MNVSKKVNCLLRKYDLFIQEYAQATPKWDELKMLMLFGEAVKQIVPPRGRPNRGLGGGEVCLSAFKHYCNLTSPCMTLAVSLTLTFHFYF